MSKPSVNFQVPDFSGQSQILFCTEGNPAAALVTNRAGRRQISTKKFPKIEAALAWCRIRGVVLVYCPIVPGGN